MKHRSKAKKGQFSIIAALLTVTIMISAVIMTYSTIRNLPFSEPPKVLSSLEELNLSLKQLLEFAIGYYGSVMQVTGNVSYAKGLTLNYLQSGLIHIAHSHPEWNPSFEIKPNSLGFSTRWYEITSYSIGNLSITYSMPSLGMSKITYNTSATLNVGILDTVNGKSKVLVTREGNKPDLTLGKGNFFFYKYSDSTWNLINPSTEPIVFSNGTYLLQIPSGVDQSSYLIKVSDSKGIMAIAFFSNSRKPKYTYTLTWNSTLYSSLTRDTIVVEALQNGTFRWLGQNLQLSTFAKPIIPIPVRILHVNQTINGINREVPFQVEDWGSNYRVPLGLTSNASLFGDRQMIVFLVNHNVQKVTLWWDGRDTAKQTPYAFTVRYFKDDAPTANPRRLTNGIINLTISASGFTVTSSIVGGSITTTPSFLRINNKPPTYGSDTAYVIYHGIVRDIVQQEAEWSGGIMKSSGATEDCPNVYSQIYLTLPANATYYTYATRLIFINSAQSRTITDLRTIQLSVSGVSPSPRTENGTSGGYPINSTATGLFYNRTSLSFQTGWAHHWSEFISGSSGAGIMFTDDANRKLYTFDSIAGQKRGALNVGSQIEFNPVTQTFSWATPAAVYSMCGQNSSYPASNAIDSDTGTYWRHNTSENHWIILDMGQTRDISQIGIYQSSTASYRWGYQNNVEVYVSNDPSNWGSTVWTGRLDLGSNWQYSETFSATGRYVKLVSKSTSSSQRLYEVQVKYPLDVTWHGAVVTFNNDPMNTIYPTSGNIGLWVIVEYPPKISLPTGNSASITVTSSPSGSGYVRVDGNATTTPATFNWAIDSTHTLQALSPVAGPTGTQYVWTGWSDGGAQTHTYIPDSNATVTANYKTQYQVSLAVSPSGSGTTTPSGINVWEDAGVISISATANPGYMFSSWSVTGSITIANQLSPSTTATISGTGIITANFVTANLALDGSASISTSGSSMIISLTTSKPNDLLYISVVESQGYTVSGITSSPSLTWTRRASVQFSSTRHLETWYAIWPSSGSINITITMTGSSNAAAVAFGVSGANTASPFDGTPRTATGSSTSPSVTISTSNPNDFIIGALGVQNTPTLTTGSGFTLIKTQTAGTSRETSDEYRIVSTTQSNLPVGYSLSSSQDWAMIADAIKRA